MPDAPSGNPMVTRKTWEEFRAAGLLWWMNRVLHVFGWAIVAEVQEDGKVTDVFPARVRFRGFTAEIETEGHIALTKHISENVSALMEEAGE